MEEEKYLERIEDPNTPMTVDDVKALAARADNIFNNVANVVNSVTSTSRDIEMLRANVELETQRLDHQLDAMLAKLHTNHQMYKDTLPIIDRQFNSIQTRMDKLVDRAMEVMLEDVSDESLKKQENMMQLIETTNESLNRLISKLLPSY